LDFCGLFLVGLKLDWESAKLGIIIFKSIMAKIIYSTYHPSSLFSFEKVKKNFESNSMLSIVMFFSLAYFLMIFLILLFSFLFKSIGVIFSNTETIQGLWVETFKKDDAWKPLIITFGISLSIFSFLLLTHLHFVLTNKSLYLFSPIFPFLIRRIALADIAFIRVKTVQVFRDETQSTLIIHLKNTEQKPYSMPWADNETLKEKLNNLGIMNVWYDFPAKSSS